MNFEMVRNADVEVEQTFNSKNYPVANITIGGVRTHRFSASSRISKQLDIMTPEDLSKRLSHGNYFFAGGELIDFRDGHYRGYVHTDTSIDKMIEVIGYTGGEEDTGGTQINRMRNEMDKNTGSKVVLQKVWSDHEIEVPLYAEGGQFNSQLSYKWNPFMKDIHSAFHLVRLICSNGMSSLTSFLNTKIPLVNRWEEHLEIASRQIQNKVSSKVIARLAEMGGERATIAECQLIVQHADARLKSDSIDRATRERLKHVALIASPLLHLGGVYKTNVFSDRRLGAQLPSHMSTFDIYNMATEINSHSRETSSSSTTALDMLANALVFDREDLTKHASRYGQPALSSFSNPDAAFFGVAQ